MSNFFIVSGAASEVYPLLRSFGGLLAAAASSRNALDRSRSESATKPIKEPWMESKMSRGRLETLSTEAGLVTIRFASPEDTVLHKRLWFRMGASTRASA